MSDTPDLISDEAVLCYCFSVTYGKAMKLFKKKKIKSFDDVAAKTKICNGCRACELNIKEYFFPEELGLD
jgi:NAD(P)H-nitrite reductase large subunit